MSRRFRLVLVLMAGVTSLGLGSWFGAGLAQAAPKAGFDGVWNVLIITDKGTCDRGYRYNLRIAGASVRYEGDGSGINIDVTGQVQPSGQIQVRIGRGDQRASGSGRLGGNRGSGTWSGQSPTSQCSGRWEAERRGA